MGGCHRDTEKEEEEELGRGRRRRKKGQDPEGDPWKDAGPGDFLGNAKVVGKEIIYTRFPVQCLGRSRNGITLFTSDSFSGLWQSLWDEDMDPPFSCQEWKEGVCLLQEKWNWRG